MTSVLHPRSTRNAELPPPVFPGDRVGVAALSGPVDSDRLDAGLNALGRLGFEVVTAPNIRQRHGLFAGSDTERLEGFYELVDDPSVKAIFFTRGGWGLNRLLPRLDWRRVVRHPRAYLGYSDLTPLLNGIVTRAGLVTFHGPMVAADLARGLTPAEQESLLQALAGSYPQSFEVRACEQGQPVEGVLLGGCLSLLVSLLGTPWEVDLEGAVLFIEDLNEPPYRLDRMLTHLRLSGTLTKIKALIVGYLHGEGGKEPTAMDGEITLEMVLDALARDFPWPLAKGLEAGHASPSLTLPLGLNARLDPPAGRLWVCP